MKRRGKKGNALVFLSPIKKKRKLKNIKTVENETCIASCALVQPVVTSKGQVLLVKVVSNAWTFS